MRVKFKQLWHLDNIFWWNRIGWNVFYKNQNIQGYRIRLNNLQLVEEVWLQGSHVAGHIDLGGISSFPLILGGGEFYTGNRYSTPLIVERALSSKTHFIEIGPCLTRTITEAKVNKHRYLISKIKLLMSRSTIQQGAKSCQFFIWGALSPMPPQLRACFKVAR